MKKRLAVVVSGWHYPLHFYKSIANQYLPSNWEMDLFCIAHRDPNPTEAKAYLKKLGRNRRAKLDRLLYKKIATIKDIEKLGFKYVLEPNTIGDWGNSNQWLEKNDYTKYDLFLFTHDDNLILNYQLIHNVVESSDYENWLILCNSTGMPSGNIRGSFEFFKKEMLDKIGGKFDLSQTKLTREGHTENPQDRNELFDWNSTVYPLRDFLQKYDLQSKVQALSPAYRVSMYCIEGERGFISQTHGINTAEEEKGLDILAHYKMI